MIADDPWMSLVVYAGLLLCTVASFIPVIVIGVMTVKKFMRDADSYRSHREDLLRRGFQEVSKSRVSGVLGGVQVTLDERVEMTYAVPVGPDEDPALVLGTPLSQPRPLTVISAPLRRPLSVALTVLHKRSMRAPKPVPGTQPLPGHANPLADTSHWVRSADPGWAVAFLNRLAAGGGIADLETDGWRVSFDSQQACLERDGMPLPFSDIEAGGARLRVLLERLSGP